IEAEGGGQITYGRLEALSDRLRDRLMAMGVRRGDRVGIYLRKSCDAVVAIFGILKAGAAYVPVDPSAPGRRHGYAHANCRAVVVIVESRFESTYADELAGLGAAPQRIVLDDVGAGAGIEKALDRLDAEAPAPSLGPIVPNPDDLAYILYTSGSTGRPK